MIVQSMGQDFMAEEGGGLFWHLISKTICLDTFWDNDWFLKTKYNVVQWVYNTGVWYSLIVSLINFHLKLKHPCSMNS